MEFRLNRPPVFCAMHNTLSPFRIDRIFASPVDSHRHHDRRLRTYGCNLTRCARPPYMYPYSVRFYAGFGPKDGGVLGERFCSSVVHGGVRKWGRQRWWQWWRTRGAPGRVLGPYQRKERVKLDGHRGWSTRHSRISESQHADLKDVFCRARHVRNRGDGGPNRGVRRHYYRKGESNDMA